MSLDVLSPAGLPSFGDDERANNDRATVLAGIDALLHNEPRPRCDALIAFRRAT